MRSFFSILLLCIYYTVFCQSNISKIYSKKIKNYCPLCNEGAVKHKDYYINTLFHQVHSQQNLNDEKKYYLILKAISEAEFQHKDTLFFFY